MCNAERLVFDGEGDAVEAMNQTMQELQASVLSRARTDSMNLDTEMSIDTAETDGSEEEVLPQEADAAQPIYSMALTIDGDDAITYLDDHYVCVRADGYEYTGGAHGTPFRQYFVFDRETGARLSLSDVVENPVEELQAKLVRHSGSWRKRQISPLNHRRIWNIRWQTVSATNRRFI